MRKKEEQFGKEVGPSEQTIAPLAPDLASLKPEKKH
jgi:hypothetical protein